MARPLTEVSPERSRPSQFWCEWAWVDGALQPEVGVHVDAGGFITTVSPNAPRDPEAVALWGVVLPGFANAHSHAFHRALRGRTHHDRGSFWTWRDLMYQVANQLDPDSYYRLARGVYGEMLLAGITTVGEFHYAHHRPDGTHYDHPNAMGEALLAAADDVGLRLTLLDTLYLYGGLEAGDGLVPLGDHQRRFGDGTFDAWAKRVEWLLNLDTPHRIGAALHSVRAVSPGDVRDVVAFAGQHDLPVHVHVSEQPAENTACVAHYDMTPIELLCGEGLGPHATFVHATHITDDDIAAIAASPTSYVCFCPTTERDLGDGLGPARDLLDAGVRLSLGSDSHATIDLIAEAHALEMNERLRRLQRGVLDTAELAAAMTAHASLGWRDVGALAAGQRADLVAVSVSNQRLAGAPMRLEAGLFASAASDITDVVVDGRHLVSNGRHHTINVVAELDTAIRELFDE